VSNLLIISTGYISKTEQLKKKIKKDLTNREFTPIISTYRYVGCMPPPLSLYRMSELGRISEYS
jgi:hypothetical protein